MLEHDGQFQLDTYGESLIEFENIMAEDYSFTRFLEQAFEGYIVAGKDLHMQPLTDEISVFKLDLTNTIGYQFLMIENLSETNGCRLVATLHESIGDNFQHDIEPEQTKTFVFRTEIKGTPMEENELLTFIF